MEKIGTCLWFDDNAEEAVKLYTSVFSNSRIGETARYPKDSMSAEGKVMTIAFELEGRSFLALNGGPHFKFNEAISLMVDCADQAEVDYYWESLTANGGAESQCGWLRDRFGLSWQIVPRMLIALNTDPDPKKAYRAHQAMLKMKKIVIADIEAAVRG
jgi:predicted 3-demethylubiquinone-9 3-methyltransferase (glyoxalase superfamily)